MMQVLLDHQYQMPLEAQQDQGRPRPAPAFKSPRVLLLADLAGQAVMGQAGFKTT